MEITVCTIAYRKELPMAPARFAMRSDFEVLHRIGAEHDLAAGTSSEVLVAAEIIHNSGKTEMNEMMIRKM